MVITVINHRIAEKNVFFLSLLIGYLQYSQFTFKHSQYSQFTFKHNHSETRLDSINIPELFVQFQISASPYKDTVNIPKWFVLQYLSINLRYESDSPIQ